MILYHYFLFVLAIFINRIYGYEGINIIFKISPSRTIVKVLKYFGAKIGRDVRIKSSFIVHNADLSNPIFSKMVIGDGCYIGRGCVFDLMDSIIIGNNVTISHRATLNTHTNFGNSLQGGEKYNNSTGAIIIKNGAYIGSDVTILESVTIGNNTVIGSKSLVNKDISSSAIAYGIPCVAIRKTNR